MSFDENSAFISKMMQMEDLSPESQTFLLIIKPGHTLILI